MEPKKLIDASNTLFNLHDELWPTYQELKGLCAEAAVEVQQARDHIEQAMILVDDKLDLGQ